MTSLEDIGQRLYDLRAKYMVDDNVGLTITYNRLKDPSNSEPRIMELRALHEEMDRAVIAAYAEGDTEGRWDEVEVPPYCPLDDEEKKRVEAFGDAVIDRLFALNARRAEEERLRGRGDAKGEKAAPRKKPAPSKRSAPTKSRSAATPRPMKGEGQLLLDASGAGEEEA